MTEKEIQALCRKAAERIHQIPFSDWPEPELLAGVLGDVFRPLASELREARTLLSRTEVVCRNTGHDSLLRDTIDFLSRTAHVEPADDR